MNIRTIAGALAISATSLFVGCMSGSGSTEPSTGEAASAFSGFANPPFPNNYVNVRDSPSLSGNKLRQIPRGQNVQISCATTGDTVNGNNVWYQTPDGGFVSAAGVSATGIPDCGPGFGLQ
jgi:hypothetical protein